MIYNNRPIQYFVQSLNNSKSATGCYRVLPSTHDGRDFDVNHCIGNAKDVCPMLLLYIALSWKVRRIVIVYYSSSSINAYA